MYLLTFVFIMIAMLGTYTQVYAVTIARIYANQTGIADTVISWHMAANSLAGNVINSNTAGGPTSTLLDIGGSCSLTASLTTTLTAAPLPFCQRGLASTGSSNVTVTGNGNYAGPSGAVYPQLSLAYNSNRYKWNTIAYQPTAGNYYVITFVPPATITATNPAPGYITTVGTGAVQLSVTQTDLLQQLRVSGIPFYSFGYVKGGNLVTAATITGGVPIAYPVPTNIIPDKSIAIISSPGHCAAC